MAEVYWIHLPEHADMFSEGYIGVTRKDAKTRFITHTKDAARKDRNTSIVGNAIKKYGDRLIVETLVICDIEYAIDLEIKLRPDDKIGWNIVKGGGLPPLLRKGQLTEDQRKARSVARKGKKMSEEGRANLVEAWKTRERNMFTTEQRQNNIRKSAETKAPWTYAGTFKEVWAIADQCYEEFLKGTARWSCAKMFDLKHTQLSAMYRKFKKGWIPSEDQLWLNEFNKTESIYGT